ncbi:hypothetical protein V5F34_01910 [Xanthobacter autotrophicus]|uniref:EF-hand domain-containing protein n=1 Tax=Xanthobacter autotrophicus TaxID=280 RepID=A0A6C1KPK9_XANAU|nr:hypothetical protein [Xanthobacter autotrophicus]TLX41476.1 hypothetical protein FBQ73_18635 [Xanthobacter autotrophicus]
MSHTLFRLGAAAVLTGMLSLGGIVSASAATSGKDALALLNKDGDDTLEIVEVIDLGSKLFVAINPDGDTTLEKDETNGRLTDADWKAINKDGDKTLEMDEWLAVVRTRFNAADANKDGKLTAKELDSPAGQKLLLLLVK